MAYIAPIHKASRIRHAVRSNFTSPEGISLIIAKSNRAEIYDFENGGLTQRAKFTIYGRIIALICFRPSSSPTDHLIIATDRYDYLTVSWDPRLSKIRNERAARDVSDKFLRDAKCGPLYLADPEGRLIGLHVYQGTFLAIPTVQPPPKNQRKKDIDAELVGHLDDPLPIRFAELDVVDMAFMYKTEMPVLAVLYKHGRSERTLGLKTYQITSSGKTREFNEWKVNIKDLETDATKLIALEDGALIVVGPQLVLCWDPEDFDEMQKNQLVGNPVPIRRPLFEPTEWVAWTRIDRQRFLLGDGYGGLHLLFLEFNASAKVRKIRVEKIGEISTPSRLVYLDNGYAFVASHSGDSQLIGLTSEEPKTRIIQNFTSLAPILDFRVLDMNYSGPEHRQNRYSSGQLRIVSGSGIFQDGSLRSVRSGVGLDDLGLLGEMVGIRGVWGLKSTPGSLFDDVIVVSFIDETRVFKFGPEGDVEELDSFNGFSLTEGTLVTVNVVPGLLLQVTASSARLVDLENGTVISRTSPEPGTKFTIAAANADTLLVVTGGYTVVAYQLGQDFQDIGRRTFDHEIACLTIPEAYSKVCAVGLWTTSLVALLSLPSLQTLSEETLTGLDGATIPRSLLLAKLLEGHPPSLLVGMGDGTLYTFSINEDNCSMFDKTTIILGTQSINLQPIPRDNGLVSVFATCDIPSIIYGSEDSITYSAVTADKATHICSFHAEAFPSAVVVASEDDLKIAKVDPSRTTQIRTLPMHEIVRRVAHSKENNVIGVVTIKLSLNTETGEEKHTCYFKIVDEVMFDTVIESVEMHDLELVESIMCVPLDNGDGTKSEKFVVGTGYQDETKDESTKGRIIVFELTEDRELNISAELEINGTCKSLDMVEGFIVAALNKTVETFSYEYPTTPTSPKLKQTAVFRAHSEPIDIGVSGNIIGVGDMMKGPCLVEFIKGVNGKPDALQEVARTYQASWITAVEMWDRDTIVCSDADGNMSIWKRDLNGVTEQDQRRLQWIGHLRVGEFVNRIRRVDEKPTLDNTIEPRAYCATTEGSIFLLGQINPTRLDLLMQLQSNMTQVIKGVGDLPFNRFRAFSSKARSAEEPYRFVDGEFIERFLELSEEEAERVVAGAGKAVDALDITVGELKTVVEGLKRLQ